MTPNNSALRFESPIKSPKSFWWRLWRKFKGKPAYFTMSECLAQDGQVVWNWWVNRTLSDPINQTFNGDVEEKRHWRSIVIKRLIENHALFFSYSNVPLKTDWSRLTKWEQE